MIMGLRDIGATLPPGFRFYPSDEELVCHYLYKKIANEDVLKGTLVEIDLHTCEPWQLPEVAKLNATEWYFFSFRDRKYATGFRTNRATTSGYWKATGKDRTVLDPVTRQIVGMRKTLVFYKNRAPNGIKTGWIMHEFRLESPHMPPKEDWVLCRVFHKSKGPEDDSSKLFESTTASCVPSLVSLDHHHHVSAASPFKNNQNNVMPYGFHQQISDSLSATPQATAHHQIQTQTNSLLNLLHFSQEALTHPNNSIAEIITSKAHHEEDDYGFLWDMNLEENSLENSLENSEMRYDHIDSNMVFI